MKKLILTVLALLIAVAFAVPAMAENAVVNTMQLTDCYVSLATASGRLVVQDSNTKKYTLMDSYGNALTTEPYTNMTTSYGQFEVQVSDGLNNTGLLDVNGKQLIPMNYGDIVHVTDRWNLGVILEMATVDNYDYKSYSGDAFYKISQYDVYYYDKLVGTLARADFDYANGYGDYLYVKSKEGKISFYNKDFQRSSYESDYYSGEYDSQYANGQTNYWHKGSGQQAFVPGCTLTAEEVDRSICESSSRFFDLQGNLLFTAPNPYDYIDSFRGDYARVKWGGKYGLIDKQGNEVVPCEYDSIDCNTTYLAKGYQIAVKDGKVGFFDRNGNETTEFKYSAANASSTYYSSFTALTDLEGNNIVLTCAAGELPERYADISLPYNDTSRVFVAVNDAGQAGVVDIFGKALIPFDGTYTRLYDLNVSNDGTVVLGSNGSRTYTIYTIAYDDTVGAAPAQPAPVVDNGGDTPADAGSEAPAESESDSADVKALLAELALKDDQIAELQAQLAEAQARIAMLEAAANSGSNKNK